jgi:hypothetical protein
MLESPMTGKGFATWALFGLGAAFIALLVAYLFPSIIPAQAAATKL